MNHTLNEPDFGYSKPRRTKTECFTPAFADKNLHRVGIFKVRYDDDGLPGWIVQVKCVGCGKEFESFFKPQRKIT